MKKILLLSQFLIWQLVGYSQFFDSEFENAQSLQEQGKFELAIDLYSKIIDSDDYDWLAVGNRAICYSMLNNLENAQKDFERALELAPNEPYLNLAVANFYAGIKQNKMAIVQFQKAQRNGAELNAQSYFNYGSIYYFNGNSDSAKVYLERSYQMDSTNSEVANNLGWTYLETEPEKSCLFFKQAFRLDSLDASNVNNLGYSHLVCGDLEVAFEYFLMSQELEPKNSFVYRNFGLYYMYKNDKLKAKENLNVAIEMGIIERWGVQYIEELKAYCEEE